MLAEQAPHLTCEALTAYWFEKDAQLDEALPFPIDVKDAATDLAVRSSDVLDALDRQVVKVDGLGADGDYTLSIDGESIGTFGKAQLAEGVNLATRETPMVEQAKAVHKLTIKHTDFHQKLWREIQVPNEKYAEEAVQKAVEGLDALEAEMVKEQRETAQPKEHQYVLEPTG